MKALMTLASAAVLAAGLAAIAAPSQASTIFASFDTGTSNASNVNWVRSGENGSLFTTSTPGAATLGAAAVKFTFLGDPSLPDFDSLKALLTLSGSSTATPAMFDGSTYTQTGIDGGAFQFVYNGANQTLDGHVLVGGVTVLMSGTFSDAWIQGAGGVGGVDVSIGNGGSANFVSNIYDLSNTVPGSDEFTLHLGNVLPNFGASDPSTGCTALVCSHVGTTALNSFTGHAGGDFQFIQASVPEPSTWGLMIVGFGGAGVLLRSRRRTSAATA
jgi:hypothetical protein